jgi:amino-acid N-acetyltransferase
VEAKARDQGIRRIFALSTQTSHWFLERGFRNAPIDALPMEKQELYNYRRNSKVFIKVLD